MNLGSSKSDQAEYVWLDTCGINGMLTSAVQTRVKMEGAAREANALLQCKKMDKDYDSTDRECFSCFYDLHLSAVSCQCSPNRFACLNHSNLLCSCEPDEKFVLYRYSMEELNALVAALGGDAAAVYQWRQYDAGLVCQSGSMQQKMDFSKSTELSGPVVDVNIDCSFDGCHDLEKPAGYSKEKDEHNKCVDLNIEDPSSSPRIKEACFSSSTSSALEKLDKDKMVIDCESLGTNNPTTNSQYSQPLHHSSELSCPPRTPAENSTLASIATKKLFGVDIEYGVAKALHAQVCQVAKPSSRQSDQVSRATILKHVVEPLDYGTVMVGKSWCNHQAIFPKGFRSRVTFHNVLDPTRTCCYISEVLDAGLLGPLFRVAVEKLPEISFTHASPIQCWDSVRDRVNEEIKRQHSAGKSGVPALLSTDSVNGLEMFGFFFPPIIQAIEALDPNHKCLDYWLSKRTPPLKRLPLESVMAATVDGTNNSPIKLLGVDITSKESEQSSFSNNSCAEAVKLGRLLKKAKLPEDSIGSRVDSSSIWSGSRQSAG
uniref:Uncharacterized protein n=1 Tax=Avena sativa TaxID=4498 RepID=A0ACD5TJV8_AVESA